MLYEPWSARGKDVLSARVADMVAGLKNRIVLGPTSTGFIIPPPKRSGVVLHSPGWRRGPTLPDRVPK